MTSLCILVDTDEEEDEEKEEEKKSWAEPIIIQLPAKRPPVPRNISATSPWTTPNMVSSILDMTAQRDLIATLASHDVGNKCDESKMRISKPEDITRECVEAFGEIRRKIRGYESQDKKKNRTFEQKLDVFAVIRLLHASDLTCHYCHKNVAVLYKNRMSSNQWTLDRIDNERAHDISNVVIACLKCNVSRRRQSQCKYALSKQYDTIYLCDS
jgi:hypothetical protein